MQTADLLAWANTTDAVTIPAIEQDIVQLESMQSATSALLSAKVQEFGDKLDAHAVSLDVNFSASEVANTRSYYALSQLYDINLRINTEVVNVRNQLRAEIQAQFDARNVTFGASVKDEIMGEVNSSVASALATVSGEVAGIQTVSDQVTAARTEILSAVDGVLDTTLPMLNSMQGVVLDQANATDNAIAVHLAGFTKPTLLEGLDQVMTDTGAMVSGLRVEYESSLAGLNAFLVQNYYTIVDADQAMSLATQALQSSLEGTGGSIFEAMAFAVATEANLTTNYLTYTQVDQAITSFDMSLNTSIGTVTAGIDVNAAAIVGINAKASSIYAIQATAGGAVGSFEVVAWDDIGGSGSAVKINADNILLEGTVSANKLVIGDFTNHVNDPNGKDLSNWSFDTPVVTPSLWVSAGGSDPISSGISLTSVTGVAQEFMNTVKGFAVPSTADSVDILPGEAYVVKAWVYKAPGSTPVDAYLGLRVTNYASNASAYAQITVSWTDAESGWKEIKGVVDIPTSVNNAPPTMALVHGGISSTTTLDGVQVIFGGMSVRKATDAVMIADGAVTAPKIAANSVNTQHLVAGSITATEIDVDSLSAISATIGILRTATSGARMEIHSDKVIVYDANNVVRVRMGNLV